MALQFKYLRDNYKKIMGQMILDGLAYEYTIYLMPLKNTRYANEIINFFGNREQNGEKCLEITEDDIDNYLTNPNPSVSAFIKVNQQGYDEIASGSIQIYNWCNREPEDNDTLKDSQIWINDVCRIIGPSNIRSSGEPIKAFFTLIEQIAIQKLGKNEVYLMVEKNKPGTNKLIQIYSSNKYNFVLAPCIEPTNILPDESILTKHIIMNKSNIIENTNIVNLIGYNFGRIMNGGGKKRKSRKVIKRRRKSKKSRRY